MSRHYLIDDSEYPSVTTVLSMLSKGDALQAWAIKQATNYIRQNKGLGLPLEEMLSNAEQNWRSVLSDAAGIGTETHNLIEKYIAGHDNLPDVSDAARNSFKAFLAWEKEHNIKWLKSEMVVASNEHGYAGTLDAICIFEGVEYVIDFKTSSGFYDEHGLQIAAYRGAANEKGGNIQGCGILRLDKVTGIPEWKDYSKQYEKNLTAFHALLKAYYLLKDRRLKNNKFTIKGMKNEINS